LVLTPEQVLLGNNLRWRPHNKNVLSLGFFAKPVWIRYQVNNISSKSLDVLLELPYPKLDHIEFFSKTDEKYIKREGGDIFPFSKREKNYINIIFKDRIAMTLGLLHELSTLSIHGRHYIAMAKLVSLKTTIIT